MKKLSILLATLCLSFSIGFATTQAQPLFADTTTSETSQNDNLSSQQENSQENGENSELEPINIEEETSKLSQTAKDVIEVIKTIFNQPIVIGGVSITLGALLVWVLGKVFTTMLSKRNSKYDQKIADLLEQIGVSKELLDTLKQEYENMQPVIKEMIENTKNIKVKERLEELYNHNKEQVSEIVEDVEEQNNVPKSTQDTIKELLGK